MLRIPGSIFDYLSIIIIYQSSGLVAQSCNPATGGDKDIGLELHGNPHLLVELEFVLEAELSQSLRSHGPDHMELWR